MVGTRGNPNEFDHLTDRYFGNANGNVGYEPGQVGHVPPIFAKLEFQRRQYDAMYRDRDRQAFVSYPISFMAIFFTPVLLLLFFATGVVGVYMIGATWQVYWPAVPFAIGAVLVAEYVWVLIGYRMWVAALVIHAERQGPLAPYIGQPSQPASEVLPWDGPPATPVKFTRPADRRPLRFLLKDKRVWPVLLVVGYFVIVGGGYSAYQIMHEPATVSCETVNDMTLCTRADGSVYFIK